MNTDVRSYPPYVEELQARLAKMDDASLKRFGQAAKLDCSVESSGVQPPRHESVVQLETARAEWQRRNPRSTIADSF
jgi:hypothetical protein